MAGELNYNHSESSERGDHFGMRSKTWIKHCFISSIIVISVCLLGYGCTSSLQKSENSLKDLSMTYESLFSQLQVLSTPTERINLLKQQRNRLNLYDFASFLDLKAKSLISTCDFQTILFVSTVYKELAEVLHQDTLKAFGFLIEGDMCREQESTLSKDHADYQDKALEAYHTAQTIFEDVDDKAGLAKVENALGMLYEEQGLFHESLAAHQRALHLRLPADYTGQAISLNNMCKVYLTLTETDKALNACEQSLKIARSHKIKSVEADSVGNIALIYHYQGHSRKALEYLKQSLELYESLGEAETIRLSKTYNNISVVNIALGNFGESFKYGEKAVNSIPPCFIDKQIGMLNTFGVTLQNLGNYTEALKHYHQALDLNQKNSNPRRQAELLTNIGTVYLKMAISPIETKEQKRMYLQKARKNYQQALELDHKMNNLRGIAANQSNLGIVELEAGDFTSALTSYFEALKIDQNIDYPLGQAYDFGNIGYAYYLSGDFQKALEYYERLLSIPRVEDFKPVAITAFYGKGKVFEAQGKLSVALDLYQRAIAMIEEIRGGIGNRFKMSFLEDKLDVYKDIILLFLKLGDPKQALYYAEKAKSKMFLELLENTKIGIKNSLNKEDIERLRELELQLRNLTDELKTKEFELPTDQRNRSILKLQNMIRELEQEAKAIQERIVNPEYISLVQVDPLPLAQFQKLLDQNSAVLEYFVTDDFIIVWIITKDGVKVKQIRRQQAVKTYNDHELFVAADILAGDEETAFLLYTSDTQQELYDLLIQPIREDIQGKEKLVIIPHGLLHYLPFHAFQHDNTYLIEEFEVLYAPSYSVLGNLLERSIPFTGNALIVGNPDGSLPSSQIEAEQIKKLLPAESILLTREDANKKRIKEMAFPKNILHFATHSIFNRFNPLSSHILLACDPNQDGENGLLEAWEVFGMELNSYLTTLSACRTIGAINNGDEIVGLTRAFFYAGTSAIIVSLWDVDDGYTTVLMTKLYENLIKNKMDKSKALQQAQLELLTTKNTIPVMFWAPFVLMGNYY